MLYKFLKCYFNWQFLTKIMVFYREPNLYAQQITEHQSSQVFQNKWNKVKINKKDSIFAKDNLWKFNCVLNKNSHWFPRIRSPSGFYNNSWKNSWKPNLSQKCRNSKRQIKSVSFQIAIQEQKMQYQSNYFHFQLTEQCTKNGKDRQSSIT